MAVHEHSVKSAAALLLIAVASCAAPPPRTARPQLVLPERALLAPPKGGLPSTDESHSWRTLLPAPFGSTLKELPFTVHEVLLFRDQAQAGAPEEAECYASDAPAPRLLGVTADEYLLCFKHDRLSRVQAAVPLPVARAPAQFAALCAEWLKSAPSGNDRACEGRDGSVRFLARLIADPDDQESAVSVVLDAVPDEP